MYDADIMDYSLRRFRVLTGWKPLILGLLLPMAVATQPACQKPAPPEGITAAEVGEAEDLELLWESALSVLRKFDLEPVRQDRAMGVISTAPTTSRQWHEFWRQDVADDYGLTHASIHTTRRQVEVRFIHDEQWMIEVEVGVFRMTTPETQITTASSVLHGLSGSLPTVRGRLYPEGDPPVRWVPLGRDGALEEEILNRILDQAGLADWYGDAD